MGAVQSAYNRQLRHSENKQLRSISFLQHFSPKISTVRMLVISF